MKTKKKELEFIEAHNGVVIKKSNISNRYHTCGTNFETLKEARTECNKIKLRF